MDTFIYHLSDTLKEVPISLSMSKEDIRNNDRRARGISYLEDKRAAYQREILEMVSKEMIGTDPKIASWVRDSCSFDLDGFNEKTRRHSSQNIDLPTEKIHKLFTELPSIRQEGTIGKKSKQLGDAITESLAKEEEVQRMINETQKCRQAKQHRRGGHRR